MEMYGGLRILPTTGMLQRRVLPRRARQATTQRALQNSPSTRKSGPTIFFPKARKPILGESKIRLTRRFAASSVEEKIAPDTGTISSELSFLAGQNAASRVSKTRKRFGLVLS